MQDKPNAVLSHCSATYGRLHFIVFGLDSEVRIGEWSKVSSDEACLGIDMVTERGNGGAASTLHRWKAHWAKLGQVTWRWAKLL